MKTPTTAAMTRGSPSDIALGHVADPTAPRQDQAELATPPSAPTSSTPRQNVRHLLASRWSNSTDYRFELVAAGVSEDLAYVVGLEHIANSVNGIPVEPCTARHPQLPPPDDEWT